MTLVSGLCYINTLQPCQNVSYVSKPMPRTETLLKISRQDLHPLFFHIFIVKALYYTLVECIFQLRPHIPE